MAMLGKAEIPGWKKTQFNELFVIPDYVRECIVHI